ncbi:hypothetical protein I552_1898 [Mycobacterium xenopi 3993]|nr:hypothetical protein I552_1898 [Mycobacterium xenopi 3993]
MVVLAEFAILEDLGLIEKVLAWRERLGKLVFGRNRRWRKRPAR